MAQEAAGGGVLRETDLDVSATKTAANQSRSDRFQQSSFAEAGRVNALFGSRLDESMSAYSGGLGEFGGPGNTVDHWRLQFTAREAGLRAANARKSRT